MLKIASRIAVKKQSQSTSYTYTATDASQNNMSDKLNLSSNVRRCIQASSQRQSDLLLSLPKDPRPILKSCIRIKKYHQHQISEDGRDSLAKLYSDPTTVKSDLNLPKKKKQNRRRVRFNSKIDVAPSSESNQSNTPSTLKKRGTLELMIESMNEVMMGSEMDSEMSRPEPLNQSNSTVPPEPIKRHNRSNTLELFAKAMETIACSDCPETLSPQSPVFNTSRSPLSSPTTKSASKYHQRKNTLELFSAAMSNIVAEAE